MASTRYLDSAAGNDANGGTSWADAKATMAGIDAIDTAGDTIYVAQTHSETTAAAVSYAFAGTTASPTKIICGDKAAQPPTSLSTTAVIATTGNTSSITSTLIGYCYGVTFDAGQTGTGISSFLNRGAGVCVYDNCTFKLSSTGTNSRIDAGNSNTISSSYINCSFKFGAAGQLIIGTTFSIKGGSVLSGGTSPNTLFNTVGGAAPITVDGFDLSNCSSSVNITSNSNTGVLMVLRDCKLPSSWTGSLNASTPGTGSVFEMFNCDSGDTHYRYRKATQVGTMQDETTLVRSGGANDGVTTYSYKMVSNANCQGPHQTLDTPEFVIYIPAASTGSSQNATISVLRDSATNLKDTEIWAEAMYLGTSGVPLASFADDAASSLPIAAGADQDADAGSSWTTTGMSNPNKQKCVVTFTPQEEGYLHVKVRLAKASTTVYIDPKIQKSW